MLYWPLMRVTGGFHSHTADDVESISMLWHHESRYQSFALLDALLYKDPPNLWILFTERPVIQRRFSRFHPPSIMFQLPDCLHRRPLYGPVEGIPLRIWVLHCGGDPVPVLSSTLPYRYDVWNADEISCHCCCVQKGKLHRVLGISCYVQLLIEMAMMNQLVNSLRPSNTYMRQ